jgi:uncharacterized protein DUF1259
MPARRTRLFFAAIVAVAASAAGAQPAADWNAVDQALGRPGTTQPDGVRRYSFPRSDLKVTLDGIAIKPALALGTWLAFEPEAKSSMVMGDLVLTQEEVNPVMAALLKGGIDVTAVHNHLLRSSPMTIYMHVEGHGEAAGLARVLRSALALSKTPLQPTAPAAQTAVELDTAQLDSILGAKGKASGGVYQFAFPRPEKVTESGMPAPASMGTATAINLQPLGNGQAATTGDFVLTANEVEPVMRALRGGGIEVTALHNHMLHDEPRLFFMHFWGHGDALALARGLRLAVDQTRR